MIEKRKAIKQSAAGHPVTGATFGLFIFLIVLLIGLPGCSRKDKSDSDLEVKPTNQIVPKRAQAPQAVEGDEDLSGQDDTDPDGAVEGFVDRGNPCKRHEYHMPPGGSEVLTFEFLLEKATLDRIEPNNLEITSDNWAEYQVTPEITTKELLTVKVPNPVWTVDGREYLEEARLRGQNPKILDISNKIWIRWRPDNTGVVTMIKNISGELDIGKYTEDEMMSMLDGDNTINYTDPKLERTFSFILEPGSVDRVLKIFVVDINVSTPFEAPEKPAGAKSIRIRSGSLNWVISANYVPSKGVFTISGPAHSVDCYEDAVAESGTGTQPGAQPESKTESIIGIDKRIEEDINKGIKTGTDTEKETGKETKEGTKKETTGAERITDLEKKIDKEINKGINKGIKTGTEKKTEKEKKEGEKKKGEKK